MWYWVCIFEKKKSYLSMQIVLIFEECFPLSTSCEFEKRKTCSKYSRHGNINKLFNRNYQSHIRKESLSSASCRAPNCLITAFGKSIVFDIRVFSPFKSRSWCVGSCVCSSLVYWESGEKIILLNFMCHFLLQKLLVFSSISKENSQQRLLSPERW